MTVSHHQASVEDLEETRRFNELVAAVMAGAPDMATAFIADRLSARLNGEDAGQDRRRLTGTSSAS
jgi:hypothetical protein